ncbi:MAG TPA: hypothetical protein VFB06_35540 [Streptosporangiaceae bacterium]|nr:hypothetical protein [Streptosporangiaceae bacterium]
MTQIVEPWAEAEFCAALHAGCQTARRNQLRGKCSSSAPMMRGPRGDFTIGRSLPAARRSAR